MFVFFVQILSSWFLRGLGARRTVYSNSCYFLCAGTATDIAIKRMSKASFQYL